MNDYVNGAFELFGAFASMVNLRRIYSDKIVKGIDWRVTAFWSMWGLWNLYYYPSLGQWVSFYCGAVLVASNTAWVVLAVLYSRNRRRRIS